MDPLIFSPSELNFGTIPIADHPVSREFTIKNQSNNTLLLRLKGIAELDEGIWFTTHNRNVQQQRKTGFDIFYTENKTESLTILPNREYTLSCIIVPARFRVSAPIDIRIPVSLFPYDPEYSDYSEDGEIFEDEIEPIMTMTAKLRINVSYSTASFKIEPNTFFLNNCRLGETQTKKVKLSNLCDSSLPIMIHSVDEVTFVTPSLPNFINLPPNGDVELIMNYKPESLGQFETKIQFDCLLKTDSPNYLKIITAVSPRVIPADFPLIFPVNEEIDFGEIYAGKRVESDIHIENKGQSSYKVSVCPIFENLLNSMPVNAQKSFAMSLTTSYNATAEESTMNDPIFSGTVPMFFKTTSMSQERHQIEFIVDSKSSTTIQASYIPPFDLKTSVGEFDNRKFVIMMQFTDIATQDVYYKIIQCSAEVCQSMISISPDSYDFGDTAVANSTKTVTINIKNDSPLPTKVRAVSGSRSIIVPPAPIEVQGLSSVPFTFTFYPRKTNPDFEGRISFENMINKTNKRYLNVSAIVVAEEKESVHSAVYTLSMDMHACRQINFQNVVSTFPAVKELVIKSKWQEPVELVIHVSNKKLLNVYSDKTIKIQELRTESTSASSNSNVELSLLTESSMPTRLKALSDFTATNTQFYKDMYTLFPKYSGREICEHFITQKKAFDQIIKNENTELVTDVKITIPPRSKRAVYVVLIPDPDPKIQNKWMHKRLGISIELFQEKPSGSIPKLDIPVSYDVVTAMSFISSHSLNFGKITTDTKSQREILIANESVIPLPFVIDCDKSISIDKHPSGVILPLSSFTVPFTVAPTLDGKLRDFIHINNIFNSNEDQRILIKANVERKSNFYVHPLDIDFGTVSAGVCSDPVQIFITNTSAGNNEFYFQHIGAERSRNRCRPLLMFHIKKLSERKLTEATELQIDKIQKKVIQLKRKGKLDKIKKNQRIIDDLSNTKIVPSETKLKQLDAKFMDRLIIQAEKQQIDCIEVQLIPTSAKAITDAFDIVGSIVVYEKGKAYTQKVIKYRAHIVPQPQRVDDAGLMHNIVVEPKSIDLGGVFVHDTIKKSLTVTNKSNAIQNFWFSANSSTDAIITTNTSERQLQVNESLEVPFDVFLIQPGQVLKEIAITTQTTSVKIPITGTCQYRNILSFTGLTSTDPNIIEMGTVPLTTLTIIEERKSFGMQNISNQTVFVYLYDTKPDEVVIYDKDPKFPMTKPIKLEAKQTVNVNLILKPVLDRNIYRSYKSMFIEDVIMATVFSSEEEAAAYSAKPSEKPDCLFRTPITAKAVIGRIGLSVSESEIFFGSIDNLGSTLEAKLQVKNRSSDIPVNVYVSCSQGVFVSDYSFTLSGKKEGNFSRELTVSFQPSSWGINQATIRFTLPGFATYSKQVDVIVFADPHALTTSLEADEKGVDTLNVGSIYIENGKPIKQDFSVQFTNSGRSTLRFEIPELKKRSFIRAKSSTQVDFSFPFDSIVYDPEDPKFSYKLLVFNSSTKSVIKIINVVGFFCVSSCSFDKESVTFERFGQFNNWAHKEETVTIVNNSNIPLYLENVSSQATKRLQQYYDGEEEEEKIELMPLLILPPSIGPIPPNEKYVLNIEPDIDALKNIEGSAVSLIRYVNKNNKQNVISMKVGFNISKSFIRLDHVEANGRESKNFIRNEFKEIEGEKVGGSWFGITNTCDEETTVALKTEIPDSIPKDTFAISLFLRATGRPVDQLVLQPGERTEIRFKVNFKGDDFFLASRDVSMIGNIVLSHDGSEDIVIDLMHFAAPSVLRDAVNKL